MRIRTKQTGAVLLCTFLGFSAYNQAVHTGQKAASLYPGAEMVRESQHSDSPSYIRFAESKEIP